MTGIEVFGEDTPSAARKLLFRDTAGNETASEVVSWWEKRRLAYNAAVGVAGLASLSALAIADRVTGHGGGGPPVMAVAAYAVAANFCYTGGWVAELLLRPVFGRRTGTVGATIFRYGSAFSVTLTLLPIPFCVIAVFFRVLQEMIN